MSQVSAIRISVAICVLWQASVSTAQEAAGPKRIYIANDDHTDYMWTLNEEEYRRAFVEMLDYYLAQIDATLDRPPPQQARWNCDGSLWLWIYERNKSAAEFQRLIERIRDGHVSAPLTALPNCYGAQPAEAVLRGMYYPGSVERRFHLRFPMAVAMENQTLPYGLGALWAGAGASYSWRGICSCASLTPTAKDREHEIYWWQGPDGSRVLMKWNSLLVGNKHMGGYAEARDPFKIVDFVDRDAEFLRRYPYRVIGAFGRGWDDPQTMTDDFLKAAVEKTTPGRQVIVSNEEDFFRDFEATYGAQLPVVSASFGNEWDLYSASMPETSASVRRAVEGLRGAEAMATLVNLHDAAFMNHLAAERDQAWMNLGIYWDHDWTADSKHVSREDRADFQRRVAAQITSYVDTLAQDAAEALGRLIRGPKDARRFFAFNPLSWRRTDVADLPWDGPQDVHVVEVASGETVPSQRVIREGRRFVRILARELPPMGYRVFEVRPGAAPKEPEAAVFADGVLRDARYRLRVDGRGAITSWIDHAHGDRELCRVIEGRAINDLGPGAGEVVLENSGPVSVTVRALSLDPLPHTTRVTLIRDVDRIEIENRVVGGFATVPTWSFAFNVDSPDLWHEEVGAVIRAKYVEEGGHYSSRSSRLDWLTLNHFAALNDGKRGGAGMTLSNADCAFMKYGNSTTTALDGVTPQLSVLVGGQVDGPKLGIPEQGGEEAITQRFALQSHEAWSATQAMKFALEHQNPIVAGPIAGDGDALPEDSYSLLEVSNPDILLWALKPSEEGVGHGVIARFWNLSPAAASGSVTFAWKPGAAAQATHIETDLRRVDLRAGALPLTFQAQQLQTFRLMR